MKITTDPFKDKKFRDEFLFREMGLRVGRQVMLNRKARGMSVAKLASLANIRITHLKSIERGKIARVTLETFFAIAKAFDCALDIRFEKSQSAIDRHLSGDYREMIIKPGI